MRSRVALAVTVLLLAAGCSSGGDTEPEAAPTETATSASPTAYPTPEEPKPIDPCSLLPAKLWHPLVSRDHWDDTPIPTLESSFGPVARCRLKYADGATAVSWGYWLRPLDLQAVADAYGGTLFDDFPGQGFGTHTLASTDAYAVVGGGQGFTVSVPEGFSLSTKGRTPMPLLRKALLALVRNIDYDMQRVDVDLPEQCPTVDDPQIRKAIGEVTHARGGFDHGVRWCDYVNNETGASINATVEVLGQGEFDFSYAYSRSNKLDSERWVDPPPGTFTSAYRGKDSWSYQTLVPKTSVGIYLQGSQDIVGRTARERRGAFDVVGFERFGRSFTRFWMDETGS